MCQCNQPANSDIIFPDHCLYIGAFLTMACTYNCHYCINEFQSSRKRFIHQTADEWVQGLSRLTNLDRNDGEIPVTLSGGEPSVHPGFYEIINRLPERIRIDILTNLSFDIDEMIDKVNPERLKRNSPYASIRVSYHPTQVELRELLDRTLRLQEHGFSIGIWGVLHPSQEEHILEAQAIAQKESIDFRTKEFLGYHEGQLYGQFKYPQSCSQEIKKTVTCKTTELLIGPSGHIYRCHHDLYENINPIGHLLQGDFEITDEFRPCDYYGHCNPCDVKVKTNWLQQDGHTSVSIQFPGEEHDAVIKCDMSKSLDGKSEKTITSTSSKK